MIGEELVDLLLFDLSPIGPVDLVAHQDEWELVGLLGSTLVQELLYPWGDVGEWLWIGRKGYVLVGDVVDQDAAISASVESAAQASELLLACSVPDLSPLWQIYLEVDGFSIDYDLFLHEIGPDCGFVRLDELLIDVTLGSWKEYELRREVFPTLNKEKMYAESPKIMTLESSFLFMFDCQNIILKKYILSFC